MKKLYLLVLLFLTVSAAKTQTLVVSTGFDNYAGTVPTIPAGWDIGWNSTSSFYTSAGNFGVAAPSYKFGNDSDYVVAPIGLPGMDSVSFFIKGNGAPFSPLNELRLYQSADSISWTQVATFDSIPTTGTTMTTTLNGDPYLMFMYHKEPAGGNIAFDDVMIYSTGTTGLSVPHVTESIRVFPSPTSGLVYINGPGIINGGQIEVYDLLGNRIMHQEARQESMTRWSMNLTGLRKGVYFIRILASDRPITRRITIAE